MRRLANLVPTVGDLDRNKAKIAGFLAGVFVPLVIVALFTVIYTGYGFGETPAVRPPIYPNF
jgi:hypothetical protein